MKNVMVGWGVLALLQLSGTPAIILAQRGLPPNQPTAGQELDLARMQEARSDTAHVMDRGPAQHSLYSHCRQPDHPE